MTFEHFVFRAVSAEIQILNITALIMQIYNIAVFLGGVTFVWMNSFCDHIANLVRRSTRCMFTSGQI